MAGQRILVTGGAGFVGSHLCDRLLADGHSVIAIDDLSSGSRDNLAHLAGNPAFEFIAHDVTEPYDFDVTGIYNLASPASPAQYQRDPIRTTLTSVIGVLNALRLGQRRGARVLQVSTSEVYGDPEVHPQPESYCGSVNPVGPRACYDEGKRCAETLVMDFHRQHGVDVRIARVFNTYGPRMAIHDGRVVSNFLMQAMRNEPLTVFGDGQQTRSLCYVSDLVEGLVRLMDAPSVPGPVNLGNPRELTVLEIAEHIRGQVGSTSKLEFHPLTPDDPKRRRPDIQRAREVLRFEPAVSWEDGLGRTLEFFRERDSRPTR